MQTLKYLFIFMMLPALATKAQNSILWSIKDPSGKHTSYVLGTYHQIGNWFVDSHPEIGRYLRNTKVAIFETIDSGTTLVKLLNARPHDSGYIKVLPHEDVIALHKLYAERKVPVSKLKPVELLITLQQNYFEMHCGTIKPGDTRKVMDDYLKYLADSLGVKTIGLESADVMTSHIHASGNNGEWKDFVEPIHQWLDMVNTGKNKKKNCKNAKDYIDFDFDYQLNRKCEGNNVLVFDRNKNWMPRILAYVSKEDCFIAVGLLHLYQECGLITQLRKNGYLVEPIDIN